MAMLPCGDFVSENKIMSIVETTQEETHQNHDQEHNHDHENETDACSPFCICACCGLSYNFENVTIDMPYVNTFSNQKIPLYDIKINSNEFLFIWKPPKIS